jgi:hypothetical protein
MRGATGSKAAKVFDSKLQQKRFWVLSFICGVFVFVELVERFLLDRSFLVEKLFKGNMSFSNILIKLFFWSLSIVF